MTNENRLAGPLEFRALLNDAQYEAVTNLDGPILVVAGAGSGKTRTLVHRVAYLVQQGVKPESILLLTFTRKAAQEMLTRAEALVGKKCARVSGGTFHSLAHELLRHYAPRLGYPNNFGIMDRADMEELLGRLRKDLKIAENDRSFPKRGTVTTIVSKAVNKGVDVPPLMAKEFVHLLKYASDVDRLRVAYAEFKKNSAILDFDDLLVLADRLLAEDEDARVEIAGRYKYIMVDEYQDTNPLQADLVWNLARDHRNVMVVGDDAQSIYSFRGASFKNIMKFPERFPETRIIRLEENYRSRQPILDVTNRIIAGAREKYDKKLFTRREGGEKPKLITFHTQKEQSLFVCTKLKEMLDQGGDPGDAAVLFRAASHSFDLELELLRYGIDYVKYGGRRFLEAAHIKDLLALLRASAQPRDSLSLTRALLLLDGVGAKTASKIAAWVDGDRERLRDLAAYPGAGKIQKSLAPVAGLLKELADPGKSPTEQVDKVWTFYRPLMESKFDDYPSRMTDVNEFLRLAEGYSSLRRFLADMALEPPNASLPNAPRSGLRDKVTLSTVHSAKGLEWRVVFVIWAAEGRFPAFYAMNNPDDLDEERRLMYVAATRAEDELYMLCPLEQVGFDPSRNQPAVSRFLAEVPPMMWSGSFDPLSLPSGRVIPPAAPRKFYTETTVAPRRPTGASASVPDPGSAFAPGNKVAHPVFGLGRVVQLIGPKKIEVDFDHFGNKILHLDHAGLKSAG
jgi:DNA helicase-2/ATP-dependent DNA helicase PcrA